MLVLINVLVVYQKRCKLLVVVTYKCERDDLLTALINKTVIWAGWGDFFATRFARKSKGFCGVFLRPSLCCKCLILGCNICLLRVITEHQLHIYTLSYYLLCMQIQVIWYAFLPKNRFSGKKAVCT